MQDCWVFEYFFPVSFITNSQNLQKNTSRHFLKSIIIAFYVNIVFYVNILMLHQ